MLETGVSGLQMYSQVSNAASSTALTFPGGSGFVVKTSDLNLTHYYMANTSFTSQGTFQYTLPNMNTQAAAAAVAARNVQKETIDYTGFPRPDSPKPTQPPAARPARQQQFHHQIRFLHHRGRPRRRRPLRHRTRRHDARRLAGDYPSARNPNGRPQPPGPDGESSGPMITAGYGSDHYGGDRIHRNAGTAPGSFSGPYILYFNATNGSTLTDPVQLYNAAAAGDPIPAFTTANPRCSPPATFHQHARHHDRHHHRHRRLEYHLDR